MALTEKDIDGIGILLQEGEMFLTSAVGTYTDIVVEWKRELSDEEKRLVGLMFGRPWSEIGKTNREGNG